MDGDEAEERYRVWQCRRSEPADGAAGFLNMTARSNQISQGGRYVPCGGTRQIWDQRLQEK
jgi:hypothetical protein